VAPVNQPLVNSIYDIAESSDINLLVKIGGTPETMFMVGLGKIKTIS
jgi:hypothetical protein